MISSYVGENAEFERQYLSGELELELTPQVRPNKNMCVLKGLANPNWFLWGKLAVFHIFSKTSKIKHLWH